MLIDIVYENGPIKFFCISAVFMLDVSIDTGLRTFLHLISICKYSIFVVFDVFDRESSVVVTIPDTKTSPTTSTLEVGDKVPIPIFWEGVAVATPMFFVESSTVINDPN